MLYWSDTDAVIPFFSVIIPHTTQQRCYVSAADDSTAAYSSLDTIHEVYKLYQTSAH